MALTKTDLQAIEKIVGIKVDTLAKNVQTLTSGVQGLKTDVHSLTEGVQGLKTDVKDIRKRVKKIEMNVELAAGFLDTQDVRLSKRITKIEKHLGLPQN